MEKTALSAAEKAARKTAEEMGYQFYSIRAYREGQTEFLEVCIDKDYRIGLDDVEAYSQKLGEELDKLPELSTPYTLDVASPGAEREFPKEDIPKVLDRYIEVESTALPQGEKAEGTIESFDGQTLVLKRFIKGRRKMYRLPYESILHCRFKVHI